MHAPATVDRMPRRTERVGIYVECRGGPLPHADTDFMDRAPDKTALEIMSPTPGMHHIFAPNFPITGITVRLQDACKFPKELPGALSATIQLQIEHYRSARSAILPEISLVILALGSFRLHVDGRFIGLNVTTAQKFPAHCSDDRHE